METCSRPLKDFDAYKRKQNYLPNARCACFRDNSTKIRIRRQFRERFISQPTNHRKKKSYTRIFLFRIFLSAARLASDRLTAALHKPAGMSCRQKVVNKKCQRQ